MDLTNCDKEQIQYLGGIQPHGCLFIFSEDDSSIVASSENVEDFFPLDKQDLLGTNLSSVIGDEAFKLIKELLHRPKWGTPGQYFTFSDREEFFEAYLFKVGSYVGLECEKGSPTTSLLENNYSQAFREFVGKAKDIKSVVELSQNVAETIRRVTSMDRVMIYRFSRPEWHGEVLAEDKVLSAQSYLNHRFPATDIPKPARDLYLRNQLRMIPDSSLVAVKLIPQIDPETGKIFDLSDSRLRAVSPIHLEYLKNMKVGASFSLAITVEEQLWGLIACHNFKPLRLSVAQRSVAELVVNHFSTCVTLLEQLNLKENELNFDDLVREVFSELRESHSPADLLFRNHKKIEAAFRAGGMAYISDRNEDVAGLTPPLKELRQIADVIRRKMHEEHCEVLAVDCLKDLDESFEKISKFCSGVLATKINGPQRGLLMILRPEVVQHIAWSGDPRKQLEERKFGGKINPRLSFETWTETVKSKSQAWESFELRGLQFLREFVYDTLVINQKIIQELRSKGNAD